MPNVTNHERMFILNLCFVQCLAQMRILDWLVLLLNVLLIIMPHCLSALAVGSSVINSVSIAYRAHHFNFMSQTIEWIAFILGRGRFLSIAIASRHLMR